MTKQNIAIASMAMDLKRVAVGFYNGSTKIAKRFSEEEIDEDKLKPYLKKFYNKLPEILDQKDEKKIAEDTLMYSTIFQNYAIHNK